MVWCGRGFLVLREIRFLKQGFLGSNPGFPSILLFPPPVCHKGKEDFDLGIRLYFKIILI